MSTSMVKRRNRDLGPARRYGADNGEKRAESTGDSPKFFARNKPVAATCHGPQILISAGLMQGRRATCYATRQLGLLLFFTGQSLLVWWISQSLRACCPNPVLKITFNEFHAYKN